LKLTAFVDGASRGNPGPAGAGAWIAPAEGRPAEEHYQALGRTTNNVAEYRALLLALARAAAAGAEEVDVFSDSLLLVQQVNGAYRVKADHLKPLLAEAVRRAKEFRRFSIAHVPREKNREADRLANLGADASESL
jgi:ribonuclease HI